jgi:hypothetical protein
MSYVEFMDFQFSFLLRHQGLDLHVLQGIVVVVVIDNHRCVALFIVPFKLLFPSLVAVMLVVLSRAGGGLGKRSSSCRPFLQLWGLAWKSLLR